MLVGRCDHCRASARPPCATAPPMRFDEPPTRERPYVESEPKRLVRFCQCRRRCRAKAGGAPRAAAAPVRGGENVGTLAGVGGCEQPFDGGVYMAAARVHRAEHVEDHVGGVLQGDQPLAVLQRDHARKLATVVGRARLVMCGGTPSLRVETPFARSQGGSTRFFCFANSRVMQALCACSVRPASYPPNRHWPVAGSQRPPISTAHRAGMLVQSRFSEPLRRNGCT